MENEDAQHDGIASRMKRPAWILAILVALLATLTLLPVMAQEGADAPIGEASPGSTAEVAADPDFSTVDDPLNGDYELFTVDDLVIYQPQIVRTTPVLASMFYTLHTANETIVSQEYQVGSFSNCYLTDGSRQPQVTRVGRFFSQPYDTVLILEPSDNARGSTCESTDGSPNMWLTVFDDVTKTVIGDTYFSMSARFTALAMDDFNGDGYEDLFVMSEANVRVATASNVNNPVAGMSFGPVTALPSTSLATRSDPASGDFNGDGLMDVVWIDLDLKVQFATVCPGPVAGTVCADKAELEVLLNPLQAGSTGITTPDTSTCPIPPIVGGDVTLTAGDYTGTGHDGLVTVQNGLFGIINCGYFAYWYEFNSDFSPVSGGSLANVQLSTSLSTSGNDVAVVNTYAESASLDWTGSDQAVVALGLADQNGDYIEKVSVISFTGGTMSQHSTTTVTPGCTTEAAADYTCPWVNGLALGRFAAVPDNLTDDSQLGLQIATLRNDGKVTIYSVNASTDYTPVVASQTVLDPGLLYYKERTENLNDLNWLVAGDLQGRSARLGPPSVIRITSHSQPSVILGAPPMHVDYILPDSSTGSDWEIVNFTAVPDAYNSTYAMSQTTTNQSSDTRKTSYTYSTAENSKLGFSLKPPHLPSISGSLKKTTEDKNETVSENYNFAQNEFTYNATTTTGLGDEIWYNLSDFNVYVYPVLGRTVCPSDIPNCTAAQEVPLYLMFSGPSNSSINPGGGILPAPGPTTEWYQPIHEPGNIFSYPWNETMIAQQYVQEIDVKSGPRPFLTDGSDQSQSLTWSTNSGDSQTAGSTNNHSYEKAYSMTGTWAVNKLLDANLKGDMDYSESSSISDLNKTSSSLGSSTGVVIDKPGSFLDYALYQYEVYPYIFGHKPSTTTVDSASLTEPIQTFGPLQAAFAVDPLAPGAGPWWASDTNPYQQSIDVALNHPVRWSKTTPTGTQNSLNCLPSGGRNDCMVFNDPDPNNYWLSEFYWMRGLFITVGGADGPQQNSATAGDQLTLQARVYNYSFKDMPAGSTLQVRFYRQPVSKSGSTPLGDLVLINQVASPGLPGFNSTNSPNSPNHKLVSTTLDTTGLDDTYQIFWVVVWAEDSSGTMISELSGHGLAGIPGALSSIGDVGLEEVTFNGVPKTFSNNVGYLHTVFYVAPEGLAAPPPADLTLAIEDAQVAPSVSTPGGRVIVSAAIVAQGAPTDGVFVQLFPDASTWRAYQSDPSSPVPRPFDVERLPHLDADESVLLQVPYRTIACGIQEILIVATAEGTDEATVATATYDNGLCQVYNPVVPFQPPK